MRALWKSLILLGALGLLTAVGVAAHINSGAMGFAYLLLLLFFSTWAGLPAVVAGSLAATGCYNFFFLPPLHTFFIEDPRNWIALAAFLATSIIVTRLVVAAKTEAETSERRRIEVEALYNLSLDLFAASTRPGTLGDAAGRALTVLGAREGGLVQFDGSPYRQHVIWWKGEKRDEVEDLIAGVGRHREPLVIASALGRDVYSPLLIAGRPSGALVARGTEASPQALASVSQLVGLALERERFIEENAHLEALRESDALKTSLLRAVSHDLTTPLTAITLQLASLRRQTQGVEEAGQTIESMAGETARLRRRIDNLLAMARLEGGKLEPRPEPTPPQDVFRSVRESLPLVFSERTVAIRVAEDCPDVQVDPALALEILVNLIENAHHAATPGSAIELVAERGDANGERVHLEVRDRGPGLPPKVAGGGDAPADVAMADVPGLGLGLEIARSLAAASGGAVTLANREGGGAIARVDLPAARTDRKESMP